MSLVVRDQLKDDLLALICCSSRLLSKYKKTTTGGWFKVKKSEIAKVGVKLPTGLGVEPHNTNCGENQESILSWNFGLVIVDGSFGRFSLFHLGAEISRRQL